MSQPGPGSRFTTSASPQAAAALVPSGKQWGGQTGPLDVIPQHERNVRVRSCLSCCRGGCGGLRASGEIRDGQLSLTRRLQLRFMGMIWPVNKSLFSRTDGIVKSLELGAVCCCDVIARARCFLPRLRTESVDQSTMLPLPNSN
jgi:hypothetical protein